uniref:Putative ovule protein n=1 Tax=Solanum chacoense TaxID=4108 RepID=A0A0V0GL92_SOLCH
MTCFIFVDSLEFSRPRYSRSLLEIRFGKRNTHRFTRWRKIVILKLLHKLLVSHHPQMMELVIIIN